MPLGSAAAWLHFYEQYWRERLDVLEAILSEHPTLTRRTDDAKHSQRSTVRMERRLPASRESVYRAWLDSDLLKRRLAPGEWKVDNVGAGWESAPDKLTLTLDEEARQQ